MFSALRRVGLAWVSRSSPVVTVGTTRIIDLVGGEGAVERISRLQEALALIQQELPVRGASLRRHLSKILVAAGGGPFYSIPLRACVVDAPLLMTASTAEIAATVLHEATHARILWWGIGYGKDARRRVETLCVNVELELLARLPNCERIVQSRTASLARGWWDAADLDERRAQGLAAHGIPNWIVSLFRRWAHVRRSVSHKWLKK
jgi:hypothetical protein